MVEQATGCGTCEDCGTYAFWDPDTLGAGGERYDFTPWVGGQTGRNNPVFGTPTRMVTRSESFLVAGTFIGSWHDSTRIIRLPISIASCNINSGADWNDVIDIWEDIVEQLDVFPQAIKIQLDATSPAYFFEVIPSSTYQGFYNADDRRRGIFTGELELECQPYAVGDLTQVTVALP